MQKKSGFKKWLGYALGFLGLAIMLGGSLATSFSGNNPFGILIGGFIITILGMKLMS